MAICLHRSSSILYTLNIYKAKTFLLLFSDVLDSAFSARYSPILPPFIYGNPSSAYLALDFSIWFVGVLGGPSVRSSYIVSNPSSGRAQCLFHYILLLIKSSIHIFQESGTFVQLCEAGAVQGGRGKIYPPISVRLSSNS